jgi:hypothetical protein
VGVDIDGVLDAFPAEMLMLLSSITSGGNRVFIITGIESDEDPEKSDLDNKEAYLTGLGFGKGSYFKLIVISQPHDTNKAKAIEDNSISMLFDNSKKNCRAAKSLCPCFLLWQTKED